MNGGACQVVEIGGEISFVMPQGITLDHVELQALRSLVDDFILWEVNEVIRKKLGFACYYGPSIQELINAEKKESYY